MGGSGSVDEIGVAPTKYGVNAFGQNYLITEFFDFSGKGVIVNEFGITEGGGGVAKGILNVLMLELDLAVKFWLGIEKGEAMVVGFGEKFHVAGGHQILKGVENFRGELSELFNDRTGNGK